MPTDATTPRTPIERAVVVLDVLLGVALCLLAAFLLAGSLADAADANNPHGGMWGYLGAFLIAPPGLLFLLTAVAVARRWRGWWWLHALPLLYPPLVLAAADVGLLSG